MYQQTTYWDSLIKKNLFPKNKKGKGIMSNDKYYEKAKEVEAIFKKKKRVYNIVRFTFILVGALLFFLAFKFTEYSLWLIIGGFAALGVSGTTAPGERNLVRWYNHQISLIEKVQLEDELRNR